MQTAAIAMDERAHRRLRRLALTEKAIFAEQIREAVAALPPRRVRS